MGDPWCWVRSLAWAGAALGLGCGTTTDSLGYDDPALSDRTGDAQADVTPDVASLLDASLEGGVESGDGGVRTLRPLTGPATYPNPLHDVLGKTEDEITAKINTLFYAMFQGNQDYQAVYFTSGTDQAYIADTYHGDVRTEGMGFAMMAAVELDKRKEFDLLWNYAKVNLRFKTGARAGYFVSSCDTPSGTTAACIDTFGYEQFVMALIFARDRWAADGGIDYTADALDLLDVMRNKQAMNGGIVDGVTNMFDDTAKLAFEAPDTTQANQTRASIEMPAYYELWAQATGDSFWTDAASAARTYWKKVVRTDNGLIPTKTYFDGSAISDTWDVFGPETYRALIDMALDQIWVGTATWESSECNTLLSFFSGKGMDKYGKIYTVDGVVTDSTHESSLVVANGAAATIATSALRAQFLQAAWDVVPLIGDGRYYTDILDLVTLLIMSGRFRVL